MGIQIKPSAAIRNDYNGVAKLCRNSGAPVFLTKNGEGDLVVMDINTYNKREELLQLREELLYAREARLKGHQGYSVEEVASAMRQAIGETEANE